MKNGSMFRLWLNIKRIFNRPFRLVLTLSGIFFALLLFWGSYLLLDSIYYSKFDAIEFWRQNDLLSFSLASDHSSMASDKEKMTALFGNSYLSFESSDISTLQYPAMIEEQACYLSVKLFKTNNNFDASLIVADDDFQPSEMLQGSGFSKEQIENAEEVIVISDILSELLFDGDACGKNIKIPYTVTLDESEDGSVIQVGQDYKSFLIVGVYKDTKSVADYLSDFKENGSICTSAYIPTTVSLYEDSSSYGNVEFVYPGKGSAKEQLREFVASAPSMSEYQNYTTKRNQIILAYSSLRDMANLVTAALLMISAFLIGQTMVFCVKERLPEFGIKRALGARAGSIALDLVMEALVYAILAFLLALLYGTLAVLICLNVGANTEFLQGVSLCIQTKSVCVTFLLSIVTCLLAVIVPIIYLDRVSIVETIRFE